MAPRQTRIPSQQTVQTRSQTELPATPPGPPSQPSSNNIPAQRSRNAQAAASAQEEYFDLDNVSGSDDDDNNQPGRQPSGQDSGVNDPSIPAPSDSKIAAADTRYFFEKLADKVVCRECRKAKAANPTNWPSNVKFEYSLKTSTSSLRPHIEKHHLPLFQQLANEKGWKILLPGLVSQARSQASMMASESGQGKRPDTFNEGNFHQKLLNFIVADDQSLNIIECPEFRSLLLLLRNDMTESIIPHRTKLRELIITAWKHHFHVLKDDLAKSAGRISLTADIWSDQNHQPYLAITAHWIAKADDVGALKLKVALIAFHRVRGSHDGETLAKIVLQLLDRAGITVKVGHFTMDNASSNGTMMKHLERLLGPRDITFDASDRQVMCFGHIVDLTCGRVISGVTKLTDEELEVLPPPSSHEQQSYEDAVARDPVALGSNVVRAIRASSSRRDAFHTVIENGNAKRLFKVEGKIVSLKMLQLLRSVRTRWDSVYYMLNRLREMQPAVNYFLALPENNDLAQYKITPQEWVVMQDIEMILSVPHRVQQVMSGESHPILSGAIPAFEQFMTTWEKLSEEQPRLAPFIKRGLDWAYMYYSCMDRTRAYVIALFLNPAYCMSWIQKHWDPEYITTAETTIQQAMAEYRIAAMSSEQTAPAGTQTEVTPAYMTLAAQYGIEDEMDVGNSDVQGQSIEQEYQSYICTLSPKNVNIIKFWESNAVIFPTLFQMAMDYLPIQASSVPCERVFSSSAETDTKRRNRISPLLMEALQMLKFHLKKERLHFTQDWLTLEDHLKDDEPDEDDLLHGLLQGNFQDGLDTVIQSINRQEGHA